VREVGPDLAARQEAIDAQREVGDEVDDAMVGARNLLRRR